MKNDGTVWSTGRNVEGQLGNGSTNQRTTPGQVSGLNGITAIATGRYHSLFLNSDGTVWAVGDNPYGELANGSAGYYASRSTPVQASSLSGITAIAGGDGHSLFLKNDGTVWAAGSNYAGALGDGSNVDRATPNQVSINGIIAIAAGYNHSLFLKNDGTVWATGKNDKGQLGDGTTSQRSTPVKVSGLTGIIAIAAGQNHSLFLKNDGTVWATGNNLSGQLGDATNSDKTTPVQVSGLSGITAIAAGPNHSLFLKNDGTALATGNNSGGQLGNGNLGNITTPGYVNGLPVTVTAYQWLLGGISITGATAFTYAATTVGSYTVQVTNSNGCSITSATASLKLAANSMTAGIASSSPIICINTALTNVTIATTSATGIGTATDLPAGVTATWASNTITISGTPTAAGTFNYSIPLTGGCGTVSAVGTITVSPTPVIFSSGNVLSFNGTNNDVYIPTGYAATDDITYETWLNASSFNLGNFNVLLAHDGWATGYVHFQFNSGGLHFDVNGIGDLGANYSFNTNTWYHVAVTYSKSQGSMKFYVNGNLTDNYTITNGPSIVGGVAKTMGAFSNQRFFNGSLDEFRVWNVVRTQAQIQALMNTSLQGNETGLVEYYNFDQGVASGNNSGITSLLDKTTSGHNGTLNNFTLSGSTSNWVSNTNLATAYVPGARTLCNNTALTNISIATIGATGIGTATGLPAGVTAAWASNTITISGTPTVAGTFNYSIPLTGGCGTVNATGTIIVISNVVGTASSTPAVCINTALTNITFTTTGATGIGTAIGLPPGVTAVWANNTITVSGTPTLAGTYNYSIPLVGGCGTVVNATGTITVTAANTISLSSAVNTDAQTANANSAITTITYSTTGATGATISGLPTGVVGNWSNNVFTISGSPSISGTFNYTITLTGGCGTVTKTGSIFVTSSDATLSSLTTSAGSITPTFASGTIAYTASVPNATTSITVTPTVNQANAIVTIYSVIISSGAASYTISLNVGANSIPIVVTAQDGTTETYTVTVTRASGVANYVWTGNVSSDWDNAANWSNSVLPSKSVSITIPVVSNYPVLSSSVAVGSINIANSATISLNGNRFDIVGDIIGNGKIKGSSTSSLHFYSDNNNTIYFESATASDSLLANLSIYGAGAITLGSGVGITDILTVNRGTLITNNHLTLKSTSVANSAVVDKVGGSIVGNVTVERFIPQGLRLYRDMGASVANAGSVYNNWQEGGNNSNGYGIHITGSKGASTGIDPVTGLDYTNTGYHSLFKYSNNRWDSVLNTRTTNLDPYQGYRVFVRGNRAVNLFSNTGTTSLFTPVTLRNTGELIQGKVTFTTSGTTGSYSSAYGLTNGVGAYSFLANPYVCPTNWNSISTSSSNITPSYWYADPTFLSNGYTTYVTYNGFSNTSSNPSNSNVGQYLQSGQAFFIQNDNSGLAPQVVISENDKVPTATKTAIFGTAMPNRIIIGLNKANKNVDGAVAVFASNYSNVIGKEDSRKFSNPGENISLIAANTDLSIDGLALPSSTVTIPIHLYSLKSATSYQLNIDMTDFAANGMNAYLIDGMLITQTLLSGNNVYAFTATTDTASYNSRFSIIFKPTTLPIEAITLAATFQSSSKSVKLGWLVKGKQQAVTYTVEHSTDGKTYQELAIIGQLPSSEYHYIDQKPVDGINYYRIKASLSNGQILYSNTTSVQHNEGSQFSVFPSPVTQGVNIKLHLHNLPVDKYTAILSNTLGQEILRKSIQNQGRDVIEVMSTATLSAGVYTITLTSVNGIKLAEQVVIK